MPITLTSREILSNPRQTINNDKITNRSAKGDSFEVNIENITQPAQVMSFSGASATPKASIFEINKLETQSTLHDTTELRLRNNHDISTDDIEKRVAHFGYKIIAKGLDNFESQCREKIAKAIDILHSEFDILDECNDSTFSGNSDIFNSYFGIEKNKAGKINDLLNGVKNKLN